LSAIIKLNFLMEQLDMDNEVLHFWFEEIEPSFWWKKDIDFDRLITQKFTSLHQQASAGELFSWRKSAPGCLAEVIILDQFSRNMFRDSEKAFAQDSLALVLAQQAIASGADKQLTTIQRSFLYMPFMHSESLLIHQQAEKLYTENAIPGNLDFELKHKRIIEKFGRYPHRNEILKRQSSAAEIAFLQQPDSSF
jgi:uncharacterized protein (DUF924 family)